MSRVIPGNRQDSRQDVGAGDHRLAPDRVEQPAEQQRAHEVADRERDQVEADLARVDPVDLRQHQSQIFIGYLVGAIVMIVGGVIQATMGVEAAQRDLEDIAPPLSAQGEELEEPGEQADPYTVGESTGVPFQTGDDATRRGGVR
jgi:hypothetical protein